MSSNNQQSNPEYIRHDFLVDANQSKLRVDKFIADRIAKISRNKIQDAINGGLVRVNEKLVKANFKVKPGDKVQVLSFEEPEEFHVEPENIPINIIYEDEDVVIVNKAPNMVVHPGVGNFTGTLLNALYFYYRKEMEVGKVQPVLVHRIDKDTSGLLVVAKNEIAVNHLAQQFKEHSIQRKYWALVWGTLDKHRGTVVGNIGRSLKDRKKFTVFTDPEMGKHAITHYKLLEDFQFTSLIECQLETGRTHQIRVHMKHIGHTLFNDAFYGGDKILKGVVFSKYRQFVENTFSILPRQALHAKSLGFVHPSTKEAMFFESDLAPDFVDGLNKWKNMVQNQSFKT